MPKNKNIKDVNMGDHNTDSDEEISYEEKLEAYVEAAENYITCVGLITGDTRLKDRGIIALYCVKSYIAFIDSENKAAITTSKKFCQTQLTSMIADLESQMPTCDHMKYFINTCGLILTELRDK